MACLCLVFFCFLLESKCILRLKQSNVKTLWREDRLRDAWLVRVDDFFMRCQSLMKEAPKLSDGWVQRRNTTNDKREKVYSEEEEFTADRV